MAQRSGKEVQGRPTLKDQGGSGAHKSRGPTGPAGRRQHEIWRAPDSEKRGGAGFAGPVRKKKTRGSLGGAKGKAGTSREDPRGGRDPRRAGGGGRCAEPLERGLGISGFSAFGGRDLGRRERRGGPGAAGRAARPELWPAGRRSARGGRFHRQPPAGKCGALKKCGASCARGVGRAKFATRVVRAKTQ